MAHNDPIDSGGLFRRRSHDVRGVRYRRAPKRGGAARRRADGMAANGIHALEGLLSTPPIRSGGVLLEPELILRGSS